MLSLRLLLSSFAFAIGLCISPDAAADTCARPVADRSSAYGNLGEQNLKTADHLDHARTLLAQNPPPRVILLPAGPLGALTLQDLQFDPPVTVRGQAPGTELSALTLRSVSGLRFENITFHAPTPTQTDSLWRSPFQITESRNISIQDAVFEGRTPSGPQDFPLGKGLVITRSQSITVSGSLFRYWHRGLVAEHASDITIRQNEITQMRSDGLNFAEVTGLLVERNLLHNFRRDLSSTDHADMIQIWTRGTNSPSRDITIRNNWLRSDPGWYTQSIFIRNEVVDHDPNRTAMRYRNIVIDGNLIENAHLHGITVGQTDTLVVRNNTLRRVAASAVAHYSRAHSTPSIQIHPDSRNLQVSGNRVPAGAALHWIGSN